MKIKDDFVTNSSSCSFVVWGISMEMSDLKAKCGPRLFALMKKDEQEREDSKARDRGAFMVIATAPDEVELRKEYVDFMEEDTSLGDIEHLIEGCDLKVRKMSDDDQIMIGVSPFSIGNDQTLTQFKEGICNRFKAMGLEIDPENLSQIEEAWEDR